MKCPLCIKNIYPEAPPLFGKNQKKVDRELDSMPKDREFSKQDLSGHLLWFHPQIDVVDYLMGLISK